MRGDAPKEVPSGDIPLILQQTLSGVSDFPKWPRHSGSMRRRYLLIL
jgi:hypothetical protein